MECSAGQKGTGAMPASATKAADGWFLAYSTTTAMRGDSDQFRMPALITLCRWEKRLASIHTGRQRDGPTVRLLTNLAVGDEMSRFQKIQEQRRNRRFGKNPFRILDEFDHWFEFERRKIFEKERGYLIAADMLRFDPERLSQFYGTEFECELKIQFDYHEMAGYPLPVWSIYRADFS